jgi:alpha-L-fucosidase 2
MSRAADSDLIAAGDRAYVSSAPGALNIKRPVWLTGEAQAPSAPLTLWYRQPAREWTEALAIGNGRLGAMVFGGVVEERVQLNESTLWAGGPYDPSHPDALKALPEVRRLIFEGKYREANDLVGAKMMARPLKQMPYQPLGDLRLKFA